MNVYLTGQTHGPFDLIARVTSPLVPAWYIGRTWLGEDQWLFAGPADVSGYVAVWYQWEWQPPTAHFPFSWGVFPD